MPPDDFENDLLNSITGDDSQQEQDQLDDEQENGAPDDSDDEQQFRNDNGELDDDDENDGPDDLEEEPRRGRSERNAPQADQNQNQNSPSDDPFNPSTRLEDRNGSLYLNGKLVAKAGNDRRNFERWRKVAINDRTKAAKLAQHVTKLGIGLKDLYSKYQTLEANKNLFEKAGLNFDDQRLMLDVSAAYKKNPLEGLKLMLTKAQMAGVDIKQLGVAGAGFDPSVIVKELTEHLDQRLKPVQDMTTRSADLEKRQQQAVGFYERNPEAAQFASTIKGGTGALAEILAKAQKLSPNQTLDQLWEQLHYKVLKAGFKPNTTVVTDPRRLQGNPPQRRRGPRRSQRLQTTGDESFADIGRDILADIARLPA